jgi:hypothetical protein
MTGSEDLKNELAKFSGRSEPSRTAGSVATGLWLRSARANQPPASNSSCRASPAGEGSRRPQRRRRRGLEQASERVPNKRGIGSYKQSIATRGVLVRVWRGKAYQVTILEEGVRYRGKRYGSLSEVAREITKTRWSGPRFFGLKVPKKNRAAR